MKKDMDIALVRSPIFLEHKPDGPHPECPERLQAIDEFFFENPDFAAAHSIEPRVANEKELLAIHQPQMIQLLNSAKNRNGNLDPDTYVSERSVEVALRAAGGTMDLAVAIWQGIHRRGFSLVRPPGHHATSERSMGFCLLNNVALAANAIRAADPKARLAIIDFDLHHGNGTQDIFYSDPDILFISSHRFPFYPGTGDIDEIGFASARGTTVNFPLGVPYSGPFFQTLYHELIGNVVNAFRPDMILVSAGYDGHVEDPMAGFRIDTVSYRLLSEMLILWAELYCDGRILFCLEGGYDCRALKDSVGETLSAMAQMPQSGSAALKIKATDDEAFERFRSFFKPYFPNL